jgi:hypothetical protein
MKKILILLLVVVGGCGAMNIDPCIDKYHAAASQISLGDSKERVCAVLNPTQEGLLSRAKKTPDSFIRDGKKYDILYFRSGRTPDGMTTDDEFTPYVFEDEKLIATGWQSLGGPKTVGRIPDRINIEQTQTVY